MIQKLHPRVAGETVTIRPIHISDLEMQQDFIRHLSPAAKRFRFFGGVRELPSPELRRLCDVDGKYSMAFVDDDTRRRVSEVIVKDLADSGVIHIGRTPQHSDLFGRVLHLVKDPEARWFRPVET